MQRKWLGLVELVGLLGGNVLCVNGEEWKPVFSDDFNRSDIFGPDWAVKGGTGDVRGNLKANGPDARMMCTRRFETPLRIECECYSDIRPSGSSRFNGTKKSRSPCMIFRLD